MNESGLYGKYVVTKDGGTPLRGVFVLRPGQDDAALSALRCYAYSTSNDELRKDLLAWVNKITG